MPRTSRIAGSFTIVMIAYWAYAMLAVPWIEPLADLQRSESITDADREGVQGLADLRLKPLRKLFRPAAWELNNPKILESDRAKLLLQDYRNLGDGRVKIHPCTIVFDYDGPAENEAQRLRRSVVLQSPGGALLRFDQPLDLSRAKVGRLVGGQLIGQVTIRSDWKQPGPEDDLLIVTRDVQLAERTIYTPHPVEFRWGPHFGRGQGMVMKLLAGQPRPGMEASGMNIAGIESFELRHIQRLHLDLGQTAEGRAEDRRAADGTSATSGQTGPTCRRPLNAQLRPRRCASVPVEIQCRGPFRFDVLRRVATFSDRVEVMKLNPDGPADRIACDLLSLYFIERKAGAGDATGKGDRHLLCDDHASMVPASGPFRQKVPVTFSGAATAEPSSLDLIAERLECRGNPVVVAAPGRKLNARAPRIEYNLLTGAIAAQGPGWLRGRIDEADDRQLEAVWSNYLRVYPHQRNQVISLDGGAELKYQGVGQLQAREIFFWLAEAPPAAADTRPRLRPDRMLARDDVRLGSPRLSGKVKQLEVWFEERGRGSGVRGQGAGGGERGTGDGKRPATAVAGKDWRIAGDSNLFSGRRNDGQSAAGAAVRLSPQHALPETSQQRYEVVGRLLRARVLLGGTQPGVSHLLVEDGVCFRETQTSRPGDRPLLIRGDRLEVVDAAEPNTIVTITGRPARFEGQGLGLTGSNINLDRGRNRLWIEGAGRMDVPLPDNMRNQTPDAGGVLTVDWRGRMEFDGGTARFEESVVAAGPSQQLRTEELDVKLRRKISFSEPNSPEQPQVEEIRCPREVAMENRTFDKQQKLNSFDRMEVTDLAVNVQSGAITTGPGWFNNVSRGSGGLPNALGATAGSPSSVGSTVAQSNRGTLAENPNVGSGADNTSAKDRLHCLHVRFQGSIKGNLLRRQLTFHEQVRTARAPVADWDAMLTTDNPDELGPDGVTLRCEKLSVVEMPTPTGNRRSIELEALGNTVVEGTTYTARGHRITYAEAKDLLVLEGDGRGDAELFRQLKVGALPSRVAARKILYWPKSNRLELVNARSLEIGRFPTAPGTQ